MTDEFLEETPFGTVTRPEWSNDYYREVIEVEQETRRSICGAPKKNGEPCKGRPARKFHHYCRIHRFTGESQPTAQEVSDPAKAGSKALTQMKARPPILINDEIRLGLTDCGVCPVRNQCGIYTPGDHCRIEERIFHRFLDTVKKDYEVQDIDMFMVMAAGWRFIGMFRAQLGVSRMDPVDAESTKVSWYGPRESKEFVRLMKELGLTRKERIEQEKDRLGVQGLPSTSTLSEMMSQAQLVEGDQVTVTQAQQVTLKKKPDEEFLIDPDESVEH